VSPGYFATLGIPVLEGRSFSLADTATAPQVALVNQSFVRRHFRGQSAIGKRLKGGDWDPKAPWTTIVGVVADVPYTSGIWGGNHPTFYEPSAQNRWLRSVLVVVKTAGDPAQLVGPIRRETSALDAGVPLRDVATMTERLDRSASLPRFRGLLFSLLGGLALVLAATGIYGVMAYHVNQRRRETAIRRALGARSAQVVRATLESGMRLAGAGIAIGVLGALVLTRSLSALLYKVDPFDPAVLAGVTALLALVAMLASLVPALRAARVDPAVILRDE
jgi:putative ABC transport system permease protein